MKGAKIALFIGVTFLVLLYFAVKIKVWKHTIIIHIHDTYFICTKVSLIIFVLLFLISFFSIGGIIGSLFRSKLFWILGIIFLSIDVYYIATFYKAFKKSEMTQTPAE